MVILQDGSNFVIKEIASEGSSRSIVIAALDEYPVAFHGHSSCYVAAYGCAIDTIRAGSGQHCDGVVGQGHIICGRRREDDPPGGIPGRFIDGNSAANRFGLI